MKDKIRVINKTGYARDTVVMIGRKKVPLSKTFKVGIVLSSDDIPIVHLELYADSVDVLGKNIEAVEKVLNYATWPVVTEDEKHIIP